MPDSKIANPWLFAGACSVLGAWVALIVATVTMAPFGHQRTSSGIQLATLGANGAGLSGPLAAHLVQRLNTAPTLTHLRLSQATRRGLFAGRGTPNARVVLLRGGRALADTRVNDNGEWQIATAISQIVGDHGFAVEQRLESGAFVVGESIRLHVPDDFRQTINIVASEPRSGFQLVAVRAESEDIGSASSRKFDELLRDGGLRDKPNVQQRRVAERSADPLEPAWNWLRDANRSYHDEVVPRIKRGGGYAGDGNVNRDSNPVRRNDNPRPRRERFAANTRDAQRNGSDGGDAWMPLGVSDWLTAARRGYATEIVPRLSGRVPPTIITSTREIDTNETEAERLSRLERERNLERNATEKAEQERLDAARRRREAELRRQDAEEEARRLAEERRRSEIEEARKIAEERRRVLERRAEQQRLALAADRQRQQEAEEQARKDREAELARAQDAAEKEALERQRLAEFEKEKRANDADAQERRRLAELDLRKRERTREEAEERRLEQERRDRLIAEAAAIKQRQAEARERQAAAREREAAERERQRERDEAQRRAQRQRLAQLRASQRERQEELARQQRERAQREREARRQRRARENDKAETAPRERLAQTRLQDLNRFKRRDTEIEITTSQRRSSGTTDRDDRADETTTVRNVQPRRTASKRRRLTRAQRRRAVRGYRRRIASARRSRGRCSRRAGRRIDPPGTYTVKRGDSLWRISKRHYRLGRYFRTIYRANKRKIRRARLIYPCQRFHLPRRRRT